MFLFIGITFTAVKLAGNLLLYFITIKVMFGFKLNNFEQAIVMYVHTYDRLSQSKYNVMYVMYSHEYGKNLLRFLEVEVQTKYEKRNNSDELF